ncbi:MAG: sigma-70 family RNA polymerase sigma factor [Ignavibacteriales bacterium]|nr:sigma-70 family RNA polymerase sigma factor [Ignavibacteriales bacterium]
MMKHETTIIDKAKRGNQTAFRKLYDFHVEPLFRFMRQYSTDTHLVEDWVQRAFIKAYKNMQSFKGNSKFETWLFTIALNEMRSDFRKPNILSFIGDELPDIHTINEEERFVWDDSMKTLLHELDEEKKSVFLLYEIEGYTHAEIASMLNINENASRTILCRAKQWLRTQWEQMEKAV